MKRILCVLSVLLLLFMLTGCSASSKQNNSYATGDSAEAEYTDSAPAAAGEEEGSPEPVGAADRKLIYNANISAETQDFDGTKAAFDALVAEFGGYIENSDVSGRSYGNSRESRYLNYTVRIPAEKLESFIERTGELMNVVSNTLDMEDVTDSYIDTQARLDALKLEESRLLELLEQAETLDEIIQLEDRVSQVRYEIDSLTGRLKAYDSEVAYSTVTLYLRDVTEYSSDSSFGSRIGEAFIGGWSAFVGFLQEMLIVLVGALPFLLLAGAAVAVIVLLVKRSTKKQREKFAQRNSVLPTDKAPDQTPPES